MTCLGKISSRTRLVNKMGFYELVNYLQVIFTVDLHKRDADIKILFDCTK
jgi:hypothetical protein